MTCHTTQGQPYNCRAYAVENQGCAYCAGRRAQFHAGASTAAQLWRSSGCTVEAIEALLETDRPEAYAAGHKAVTGLILGCVGDFERAARDYGFGHETAWSLIDEIKAVVEH